ncbi:ABC transporter permease [Lactococcus cremoris]|jgi:ABC-2 type transport system permease protein|uniref:ABC-type transporter ATP-binding protein n=3 Tax=Lactococcus lactis subsp. cremoris TaxID=1359 RepID=A2RNE7_LACLM|nr:ABC transporter permease [Lactococcus cremoris]MCI1840887.1 ABC transporter permease [Lactococcus lactis]ADJ61241.1 ABC-type transporter ATP-binding protein [Lactococcus cremoris subsp. cremoris NZ9000]KEY63456.1 putative ABC-type exoprotein transport system, permease component [Lactococcus cremoris subsp. cremoris GE214]KZK38502.1 ABC transporter permease protein EscB [Lactococcus cremoris]KZK49383.1 ABC transporter permease protein EscB [Lactococcus cremoris]
MNEIFKKRRNLWYQQNIKYLRYVFNDHFVLFLMILLGALVVQYVNFLQVHHLNLWGKIILVVFVSLLSQVLGRLATFIEAPDKVFLLTKELEVRAYLIKCLIRSLILPAIVSGLLVLIAAPLLKFNPIFLILWFLVLVGIKAGLLAYQIWRFQNSGLLDWSGLIDLEEARKTGTLRLFSLFTNVKGLKSHSHRRKYLDFLLTKTKRTYEYLFTRSFLRSGDYLGLTIRLLILSILSMIFVKNGIVAIVMVVVFNYLLIFQLLSLQTAFDYQLLTRIYPLKKAAKTAGLRMIIFRVMMFVTIVELVLSLIFVRPFFLTLVILLVNFLLTKFYVRFRLKNK